jgi:Bacterial regulatory proteins, gntR family
MGQERASRKATSSPGTRAPRPKLTVCRRRDVLTILLRSVSALDHLMDGLSNEGQANDADPFSSRASPTIKVTGSLGGVVPEPIYRTIAEDLRRQIEAGELRPGQQLLTENELRDYYGASRNTIRDAIKWLVTRGLVETRPGQRSRV